MGRLRHHEPVLPVMAVFSRYDEARRWGIQQAEAEWGPVALTSPVFDFHQTDFYQATMGSGLQKMLVAFTRLMDPAELVARKIQTNQWEAAYAEQKDWPESRPLNLDPGYLTQAKLVLASTKDRDHRLYLDQGIFAEGTLYFHGGQWRQRPWTYPDFQSPEYHLFFDQCRDYYRRHPDRQ